MSTGKIGSPTNMPASPSTTDVNNVANSSGPSTAGTPALDTGKQETPTGQNVAQHTAEATEAKGILDSAAEFLKKTLREAFDSSPNKETKTKEPVLKPPTPLSGSPQPATKGMENNPQFPQPHPSGPLIPPVHPHPSVPPIHPSSGPTPPIHPNMPLDVTLRPSSGSPEPPIKTLVNDRPAVKLGDTDK